MLAKPLGVHSDYGRVYGASGLLGASVVSVFSVVEFGPVATNLLPPALA